MLVIILKVSCTDMHSELNFDFSAIITVSSTHSEKNEIKQYQMGRPPPSPWRNFPWIHPLPQGRRHGLRQGGQTIERITIRRGAPKIFVLCSLWDPPSAHLRFKTQVSKHAMKLTRCFSKTPKNAQIKVWRKSYRLDGSSAVYDAYMFQFQLIQLQKNCEMPACQ